MRLDSDAPSSPDLETPLSTDSAPEIVMGPDSDPEESAPVKTSGSLVWRLGGILRTIRPHQWVKNVFVLAPVVFAKEIFDIHLLKRAASAFLIFCLLAGAVYTINDLADIKADRMHPVKRHRPIASGRLPTGAARLLAVTLVVVALAGAATLRFPFIVAATGYLVLNLAYSLRLKHVAYLDVGCLGTFFVLRVLAGGYAAHITVSAYLLGCTLLLALFLGFGKRRHELTSGLEKARSQRAALGGYRRRPLDIALGSTAIATLATYLVYTLDPHTRQVFHNDWLWLSSVFVGGGILRFLHIVRHRPKAESPTQEMLGDGPFIAIVLGWVGLVMWVVYQLTPG